MIYLKRIFPSNLYDFRPLNVFSKNGSVYKLQKDNVLKIEDTSNNLELKLDYHKTQLDIDAKSDNYYVVYLEPSSNLFLFYLKIMFKNALKIKKVSKKDFQEIEVKDLYRKNESLEMSIDSYLMLIFSVLLSLSMIYVSIFNQSDAVVNNRELLFLSGMFTALGFIYVFIKRSITKQQLTYRFIAFIVLILSLSFLILR